jgi:hypothetical protein
VHASDHTIKPIRYLYEELNESVETLPRRNLEKISLLLENIKIKKEEILDN